MVSVFKFAEYELDIAHLELRRSGKWVSLESHPLGLLIRLVQKNGELLTREEMGQALWGRGFYVDTEQGIRTAVGKIRQALHDDPAHPRFIEAVGKGYRFAVPVSGAEQAGREPPDLLSGIPFQARAVRQMASSRWLRWALVAGLATLSLLLSVLSRHTSRGRSLPSESAAQIQSIAVLPFVGLSDDPQQREVATDLTDELITALSRIQYLRVTPQRRVMRYQGTDESLPQVARELGVDDVVQGAVFQSDNGVHITIQLIQPSLERTLWSQSYDEGLQDIVGMQEQVVRDVTRQISIAVNFEQQPQISNAEPVTP